MFSVDMGTTLSAIDLPSAPRERVLVWLREGIEQGRLRPGMSLPPERALATHLGVSRDTVRAALIDAGNAGLVENSESGRGRRIAGDSAPREGLMSRAIAILSESPIPPGVVSPSEEGGYFKSMVAMAVESASLHALGLSASHLDDKELRHLAADPPRGVIVVDDPNTHRRLPEVLRALPAGVPVVARVWRGTDLAGGPVVDRVVSDHAGGAEALVRWLAARGHRRILRLWETDDPTLGWIEARNAGYARAVQELQLPYMEAVVVPPVQVSDLQVYGGAGDEERFRFRVRALAGYLADYLLGERRIDALMVLTDAHAYEAAAALRVLRLEPNRDVMIAGYDNHGNRLPGALYERTGPRVTVDKATAESARMMVELVEQRNRRELPDEPQVRLCRHRLIELTG